MLWGLLKAELDIEEAPWLLWRSRRGEGWRDELRWRDLWTQLFIGQKYNNMWFLWKKKGTIRNPGLGFHTLWKVKVNTTQPPESPFLFRNMELAVSYRGIAFFLQPVNNVKYRTEEEERSLKAGKDKNYSRKSGVSEEQYTSQLGNNSNTVRIWFASRGGKSHDFSFVFHFKAVMWGLLNYCRSELK